MRISQKMIADISGVSRGTVDRVLNGKPNVKPETREKVLAAAAKLHYSPNMTGRALALSKRAYSICAVMPKTPFFEDVIKGIDKALEELQDYNISISYVITDRQNSDNVVKEITDSDFDAYMLAVEDTPEICECIKRKTDSKVPVITFNTDVSACGRLCFVGQDLYKSGRIAASLMLKMTDFRSNLLVVTGSNKFKAHRDRVQGFMDVIGDKANIVSVIETEDDAALTYERVEKILSAEDSISGIYAAAGHINAFLSVLREKEKKYSVVVNDLLPEITEALNSESIDFTIFQDPAEQGYRSVKLLFEYLFCGKKPESEYYYTGNIAITKEML